MNRALLLGVLADARAGRLRDDDARLRDVALSLEPVAGRVRVVRGAGANVGVLATSEGCLLVDGSFAPLAPRLRALLRAVEGGGRVRWLVDTHWHADHTHGSAALAGEGTIVAHAATRRRLAAWARAAGLEHHALPALTFEEGITLHLGGEEIHVWHPGLGHTDGDVLVYFASSNVLQAGDLFVTYGLPFVDRESGGTVAGLARALERGLRDLPADAKVLPGHGPPSTRADALAFAGALRECVERVRAAVQDGWSVEEMLARGALGPRAPPATPFVSERDFLAGVRAEVEAEGGGAS